MFERLREYFSEGIARPHGTMWAMERSYFEFKHKYPGKEDFIYLRMALQARYPEKKVGELNDTLAGCSNLEDVIVQAIELDFGFHVASRFRTDVLQRLQLCTRCRNYRALSGTDSLCYGCRKFGNLIVCPNCRLYWESPARFCPKCGKQLEEIKSSPAISPPVVPADW